MITVLASETLKTGETMQVARVLGPDAELGEQIRPFLGHKGPSYNSHIEKSLAGECDDLETYYYVGLLDGTVVGNIMTVEANGVGILGHVNTREDQRRKGICQKIMQHQMEDFRQRGGKSLILGTGYQSPAYWIYHSFGFRDMEGGSPGKMRYDSEEAATFEARFYAPGKYQATPARWKHWPLAALTASLPAPAYLRSLTMNVRGVSLIEGEYSAFLYRYEGSDRAQATVLESETGAVVAVATMVPDGRWDGIKLLDVFAHPNVGADDIAKLVNALPIPGGKIQCYADPKDDVKIAALGTLGFERQAILPGQVREGETWRDVWLFTRND